MIAEHKVVLRDSVTHRMTDEEFFRFCIENDTLRIERDNNLNIYIMPPVGTFGSYQSGEAFAQLAHWNKLKKGGKVFDSSAGFTLPDHSVLSPDASWVSNEKWERVPQSQRIKFAELCPDFVIEVRSKSDSLEELKLKMVRWISNGVQLAWLIDPIKLTCYIFSPVHSPKVIKGFDKPLKAGKPVEGFTLSLSELLE
jgi:Uma2 family endonuclease